MKRRCKKCGLVKPLRMFYPGRLICRECVGARAKRVYRVRTAFPDGAPFVCRQCGETKPATERSTYARDLCKKCHAVNLLEKKAAAPERLTCRVCGETKPKAEFERYSVTRCKACAAHAVKQYGKGAEDE